jgi:hypothetical protein
MPVWKFAESTPAEGTTELEDASLDLAAYYQSMEDLATWLQAHDGVELEDVMTYLAVCGLSIEDLGLSFEAYHQSMEDLALALTTLGLGLTDIRTWLSVNGQERQDLASRLTSAGQGYSMLPTTLQAVSPTVFLDLGLYLSATSGTVLDSLGLALYAVKTAPAFQSIVAQRLESVMADVS